MTSEVHIHKLPVEVLLHIFSYLEPFDLVLVQEVCSYWKELSEDNNLWENAVFKPKSTMSDPEIANSFKKMPRLKSFVTSRKTPDYVFEALFSNCTNLQSIDLYISQKLEFCIMERLLTLPYIDTLKMGMPSMDSCLLIGRSKTLKRFVLKLDLLQSFVGPAAYSNILVALSDGCPNLEHVDIGQYVLVRDVVLYLLEKKKHMLLSFAGRGEVSWEITDRISECSRLQHLELEDLKVDTTARRTSSDLLPLTKLKELKHFTLRRCSTHLVETLPSFFCSGVLSQAVHIDLSNCYAMDDNAINTLCQNCPLLKTLLLSGSQNLHDEGMKYIDLCQQLSKLDLSSCLQLTDKSMEYVGNGCKNLQHLAITGCFRMTDKAVEHIAKCRRLKVLEFSCADLTGSSLHLLRSNTHLNKLHLESCKDLQKPYVDNLQRQLSQLQIIIARTCERASGLDAMFHFNRLP